MAPRRRYRISFRTSLDERNRIDADAARAGLRISGYARAVLLGAKPLRASRRPRVEVTLLTKLLVELGAITTALISFTSSSCAAPVVERGILRTLADLNKCGAGIMKALGRKVMP